MACCKQGRLGAAISFEDKSTFLIRLDETVRIVS